MDRWGDLENLSFSAWMGLSWLYQGSNFLLGSEVRVKVARLNCACAFEWVYAKCFSPPPQIPDQLTPQAPGWLVPNTLRLNWQALQLQHAPSSNDWDLEVEKVFQSTSAWLQKLASYGEPNDEATLEDLTTERLPYHAGQDLDLDLLGNADDSLAVYQGQVGLLHKWSIYTIAHRKLWGSVTAPSERVCNFEFW